MKRILVHSRRITPLLVLALAVSPLVAQTGGQGFEERRSRMFEHMIERLDLTEQQQQEAKRLLDEHRTLTEVTREENRARQQTLNDLMQSEQFDETAIRSAAMAAAETHADLTVERARLHHKIRELLTPEQFARTREMMERHRGSTGHGHGFGAGHPSRGAVGHGRTEEVDE